MEQSLERLQERLGYRFRSETLLVQALTHRSHGKLHNERLEFLGDSVLNCAIASMLYGRFGRFDEGDLSRLRSNLVKQQALFEIGQALGLGEFLVLGEGERRSGGLRRPSILADTVEAIVGAVFLDADFAQAAGVIEKLYEPVLKSVDPKTLGKDAKTLLQEYLQGRRIPLPVYEVVATHGAAHSQVFEVECSIPKLSVTVSGSGGSRRAAEQAAAKLALESATRMQAAAPRRPKTAGPAIARGAKAAATGPAASGPAANATVPAPEGDPSAVPEPDGDAAAASGRSAGIAVETVIAATRSA
jgi:ribonuclease III